jgi:hypothetical protein
MCFKNLLFRYPSTLVYISLYFFSLVLFFRYEQAEFIEREMEQMTEQIKSVIQTVNANQVTAFIFIVYLSMNFLK